jgi:hypothetical protein
MLQNILSVYFVLLTALFSRDDIFYLEGRGWYGTITDYISSNVLSYFFGAGHNPLLKRTKLGTIAACAE